MKFFLELIFDVIYFFGRFFQLFEKYNGPKNGHLKLKHPDQLQVCWIKLIDFVFLEVFFV